MTVTPRMRRTSKSPPGLKVLCQRSRGASPASSSMKSPGAKRRPRSRTHTRLPASASRHAAMPPPNPEPTTTTSYAASISGSICSSRAERLGGAAPGLGGGAAAGALAPCGACQRLGGFEHRAAGVVGLEHDGVAGLLQDLARQPVLARVVKVHDHRAVRELLEHAPVLAGPAGALR